MLVNASGSSEPAEHHFHTAADLRIPAGSVSPFATTSSVSSAAPNLSQTVSFHMTLTFSTQITSPVITLNPGNNRAAAMLEAKPQRNVTSTLLNAESKSSLSSWNKPLWCSSRAGQRQFCGRSASQRRGEQRTVGDEGGGWTSCCVPLRFQKTPGS